MSTFEYKVKKYLYPIRLDINEDQFKKRVINEVIQTLMHYYEYRYTESILFLFKCIITVYVKGVFIFYLVRDSYHDERSFISNEKR